ncbi:hypothetical protein NEFER03_1189 [Nematocida sp. LUAm3]|nr:hypothetical protein NEFER03_1189 [Nematocida sp. LUAm3]KAI5175798.1 hypothetical protein NEFER02_1667 [Nematocida sp. LUAm2]KAI5178294.1 hypothetical protein NEFER01_1461 [Nematocida sp. LUAm1]
MVYRSDEDRKPLSFPIQKHLSGEPVNFAFNDPERLRKECMFFYERVKICEEEKKKRVWITKRIMESANVKGVVLYSVEEMGMSVASGVVKLFCCNPDDLSSLSEELREISEGTSVLMGSNAIHPFLSFVFKGEDMRVLVYGVPGVDKKIGYIRRTIKEFPVVKKLSVIIGRILLDRNLYDTPGVVSEYFVVVLIELLLKTHPLVQGNCIDLEESIGLLLMDLFQMYGRDLNYERVMGDPKNGRFCRKKRGDVYFSLKDPIDGSEIGEAIHLFRHIENLLFNLYSGTNVLLSSPCSQAISSFWAKIPGKSHSK